MFPILILREEIVCLIVLIFLWLNGRFYKLGKDRESFKKMLIYATGHVIFDIVTVLAVNNLDGVLPWVNKLLHAIFYSFAILFAREFFCYIIKVTLKSNVQKQLRIISLAILIIYLAVFPFLDIVYIEGQGTNYSYGMAAYIGYAIAMLLFVASGLIVILKYKNLEEHVRYALTPMLISMVAAEIIQIIVPELLFTGGAATIITVGFFFSLENPAYVFKKKYLMDALTGVKNRHSYEADMKQNEREFALNPNNKFCLVFFDINDLKIVNDKYGHLEGDECIGKVSAALVNNLKNVEGIYRMGGDEFLAIYKNKSEAVINQEISDVISECEETSKKTPYKVGVAVGYAISEERNKNLTEVLRIADYMMYKNKVEEKKIKASKQYGNDQALDITGLTDRIFDAFAATGDRNYLTLCNMNTNVSRWSKAAVEYFGLPGEFIFDCMTVWMGYIHPEDVADYLADINAVFSGKQKYHNIEYRVRNKDGEYVMCTCRGTILKGKNGEPDMFAATLVNHGIAEYVDGVTGVYNEQKLIEYAEPLIAKRANVSFLEIGIFTFDRINLLYGHSGGDEVLYQFAKIINDLTDENSEVFRLNGTKFLLCLPNYSYDEVSDLYSKLQVSARKNIVLDGTVVTLRIAGGLFIMDESFIGDIATIRNDLSSALSCSKKEQHGKLISYNNNSKHVLNEYHDLLATIHQDALREKKGFYLKYQPICDLQTRKIVGAEALLRWKDENNKEIGPEKFIPWLENDPCFFQLGKWIMHKALSDAKKLLNVIPNFIININVTVLQLEDERFASSILSILKETNFPPENVCLELTERCRELDIEFINSQIDLFHKLGIKVALDDIGTGFSSLDILLRIDVDEIKIDKSFTRKIYEEEANQVFVQALIDAANVMGCKSCLEGIEDEQTYEYLKKSKASVCQGYYFSKPIKIDDLMNLIENNDK